MTEYSKEDVELIGRAFVIANRVHMKQTRKWTGMPYIVHPVRVARMMMLHAMGVDARLVAVALLHDVVEDCDPAIRQAIIEAIRVSCGEYVIAMVLELTNPSCYLPIETPRVEKKKLDFAHIAGISREAKIIKLMDRLDNIYDALAPGNFMKKYLPETIELAELCKSADPELCQKIHDRVNELANQE